MNEGTYAPPFYTDLYNFHDGSQDDIFEGFYASIPTPGPNQTALPQPNNNASTPVLPSSLPLTPSSSSNVSASTPPDSIVYPTPPPSNSNSTGPSPPAVTVTNTVYVTVLASGPPTPTGTPSPSNSTNSTIPSPSGGDGYNVISLNKRKPM